MVGRRSSLSIPLRTLSFFFSYFLYRVIFGIKPLVAQEIISTLIGVVEIEESMETMNKMKSILFSH